MRKVSPGAYVTAGQPIVNLEKIDTLKVDFKLPELFLAVSASVRQSRSSSMRCRGERSPARSTPSIRRSTSTGGRSPFARGSKIPSWCCGRACSRASRSRDRRGASRRHPGKRHRAARRREVRVPHRERQGGRGQGEARPAQQWAWSRFSKVSGRMPSSSRPASRSCKDGSLVEIIASSAPTPERGSSWACSSSASAGRSSRRC